MTDLFPGLRRMQSVLPEHGCLLLSPGNYWQNQRELFDSDPDLLKTIQKHEPKGLHTSATLRGTAGAHHVSVSVHFCLMFQTQMGQKGSLDLCVNLERTDEESYERILSSVSRFRSWKDWRVSSTRRLSCFHSHREQAFSFPGLVIMFVLSNVAH